MKKIFALSIVAAASLGLAACSETPANEATEVTNEADVNATVEETIADLNATAENAVDTTGATLENAGEAVENGAEAVANEATDAM